MTWLQEYGSILFGLLIGTLAHFGRLLSGGGELPDWRQVVGFLMQLAMIGVVAAVASRMLGITDDDMRALATAILAISAQEVIQYLKRSGWQGFVHPVAPNAAQEEQRARAVEALLRNNQSDEETLDRLAERMRQRAEGVKKDDNA